MMAEKNLLAKYKEICLLCAGRNEKKLRVEQDLNLRGVAPNGFLIHRLNRSAIDAHSRDDRGRFLQYLNAATRNLQIASQSTQAESTSPLVAARQALHVLFDLFSWPRS